ncbi:hypothetical protein E2C01_098428 [Portunus trituberculatus]|uniref:Uncharacterized protein n=1 Tax=Portunus trituberculatus TaxID=210409 RepID=A0A5B7K2Z1_PORTR|nr:hypothetical protein [Portunus trituberculatus]
MKLEGAREARRLVEIALATSLSSIMKASISVSTPLPGSVGHAMFVVMKNLRSSPIVSFPRVVTFAWR